DCVVLRDNNESSLFEMMDALRIPIINAGNGVDEHPTQALADMYAIFKWRPELIDAENNSKIRIGVIGVPNKMRTVRSFLKCLSVFPHAVEELVIIHDEASSTELFGAGQREELIARGIKVTKATDLEAKLPQLDVVYIN